MNQILLTILIIALVYYFGYYLPTQKKLSEPLKPFTISHSTQTTNLEISPDEQELAPILDELITNIRQLNHSLK